eukprot:56168_1
MKQQRMLSILVAVVLTMIMVAYISIAIPIKTQHHSNQNTFPLQLERPKRYDLIISERDEKKIFSQNGEDGIIETIFKQIGTTNKYFVEFGTESGSETNTRHLRENEGWNGLLMDGGYENARINLHKEFIFESNIVQLFQKYNVSKQFDLLSTDTDFKDFWISQAILEAGYKPNVIVSEINPTFAKRYAITVPLYVDQETWDGTNYFGTSPMALVILYRKYNYSLVYCNKNGCNCFWIHNDYLSTNDTNKLNEYQHILDVIRCPTYGATRRGHPKLPFSSDSFWQEIVPLTSVNDFYVKRFEMSHATLDAQRCE